MSVQSWGDPILDGPEDKYPDTRSLGLAFGRYHLIGASVRGRMHVRSEIPREDAMAVYHEDDWLAVAVSDGVGSSEYSRLGASRAVNRVCQNLFAQIGKLTTARKGLMQRFTREVGPRPEQLEEAVIEGVRNTAGDLRDYSEDLAKDLERPGHPTQNETPAPAAATPTDDSDAERSGEQMTQELKRPAQEPTLPFANDKITLNDLHCTLLAIVLNLRSGTMALAQIGDGLILGLTGDLRAIPLIEPQMPGQTGQTYVITQNDWERYCSVRVIPGERTKDYVTVFSMTDGVADDCQYGPPEDILQRWAKDMDTEIRKYEVEITRDRLTKYLSDYQVKGSYDDRTLVAIYRPSQQ